MNRYIHVEPLSALVAVDDEDQSKTKAIENTYLSNRFFYVEEAGVINIDGKDETVNAGNVIMTTYIPTVNGKDKVSAAILRDGPIVDCIEQQLEYIRQQKARREQINNLVEVCCDTDCCKSCD